MHVAIQRDPVGFLEPPHVQQEDRREVLKIAVITSAQLLGRHLLDLNRSQRGRRGVGIERRRNERCVVRIVVDEQRLERRPNPEAEKPLVIGRDTDRVRR